jgi:hypothetical protein
LYLFVYCMPCIWKFYVRLLFEDFQEQVVKSLRFSLVGNKASALDHFVPIAFLSIL